MASISHRSPLKTPSKTGRKRSFWHPAPGIPRAQVRWKSRRGQTKSVRTTLEPWLKPLFVGIHRGSSCQGFHFGGAKWISSIHSTVDGRAPLKETVGDNRCALWVFAGEWTHDPGLLNSAKWISQPSTVVKRLDEFGF